MDRTYYIWRVMKTKSHTLACRVCLAPTSKNGFLKKLRRLVVTKLDNYFILCSAFYYFDYSVLIIFFDVGFFFTIFSNVEKNLIFSLWMKEVSS